MNKYTAGIILGILGALQGLSPAQGLSPKGTDPLIFEYDLKGPATYESEAYKTRGTIKTIYAYYDFEGEVDLAVSANGGSHYTKITNGGFIKNGFMPGNQLRFKAYIKENSTLKKVVLGYEDLSGAKRIYQNPDLEIYQSKVALHISGAEKELYNYPVELKGLSLKGTVPEEIYFTSADGQTPLYYYAETPYTVHGTPYYYVKVPHIPKEGTTIYMYYSKKGLSPKGTDPKFLNAYKVFPFYDDFDGEALNEEKWEASLGLANNISLKDGYLQIKDGMILSRNFKIKEGILEFKAKAEKNSNIQGIIKDGSEYTLYSSGYPGAEHTIAINNVAKLNIGKRIEYLKDYIYKAVANKYGIIFERFDSEYNKDAQIQFLDVGSIDDYRIGLKTDSAPIEGGYTYYDWVRVRPYCEIEPTVQGLSPQGTDPKFDK